MGHYGRYYDNLDYIGKCVFENCVDCLYYGYGFGYVNTLSLDKEKAKKIWHEAKKYMSK
jgi:hypothetical protein